MGGSARALLTGERMRDTDLFFATEADYKEFESRMLKRDDVVCEHYARGGVVPFIFVRRKSDGHCYDACNWRYGSLDDHINDVDWLHTAVACDMSVNILVRPDVLESIQRRVLVRGTSTLHYNLQLERMYRFLDEGWTCDPATYLDLASKVRDQLAAPDLGVQAVS